MVNDNNFIIRLKPPYSQILGCIGSHMSSSRAVFRRSDQLTPSLPDNPTIGPIVRIGHDEVHCSDPNFSSTLFGSPNQIRDKPQHMCNILVSGALPHSTIVTTSQALHRARRAPMSRFFSRAHVFRFEDEVLRLASVVVDKMLLPERRGKSFDVRDAFNCFTADVVFLHALGKPLGFVEMQEAWTPNLATWTEMMTDMVYLIKHNAWARWAAIVTPKLAGMFSTSVKALNELMNVTIPGLLKSATDDVENDRMFPILLRGGMDGKSQVAPGAEMDMFRLGGEATVLLTAGTETTSVRMANMQKCISSKHTCVHGLAKQNH